jgi:D-sedoheptulose 7-phosphate isomerase
MKNFSYNHLQEAKLIIDKIDIKEIEKVVTIIQKVKKSRGRIFFIGVGGSAANASHAVNDFRKIAGIECYSPSENVSELTARINDEGWDSAYANWLKTSNLNSKDLVLVFSVGGGNLKKKVSINIVKALIYAKNKKAKISGIVSRDGGYTAKVADCCLIIPTVNKISVTPHAEAFQAVIWHLIVSHPKIKKFKTKW